MACVTTWGVEALSGVCDALGDVLYRFRERSQIPDERGRRVQLRLLACCSVVDWVVTVGVADVLVRIRTSGDLLVVVHHQPAGAVDRRSTRRASQRCVTAALPATMSAAARPNRNRRIRNSR